MPKAHGEVRLTVPAKDHDARGFVEVASLGEKDRSVREVAAELGGASESQPAVLPEKSSEDERHPDEAW